MPVKCPKICVREERLEEAVLSRLNAVDLSAEEVALADIFQARLHEEAERNRTASENALRLQADQVQGRIAKLTDLLIDGTVDKVVFEEKRKALFLDQAHIREQLLDLGRGKSLEHEKLSETVELAKSASMLYQRADMSEKRRLLKTLLSNFVVSDQKIEITLTPAFQTIAERQNDSEGSGNRGTCRTWEQTLKKLWKQVNRTRHEM